MLHVQVGRWPTTKRGLGVLFQVTSNVFNECLKKIEATRGGMQSQIRDPPPKKKKKKFMKPNLGK